MDAQSDASRAGSLDSEAHLTPRRDRAAGLRLLDLRYPGDLEVPRHEHEHAYLCLVVNGGFEESWAGAARTAGVGSLFYYPAQLSHRGRYHPGGARVLHVEIPGGDLEAVAPGASDRRVGRGDLAASHAAALAWQLLHGVQRGEGADGLVVESLTVELVAEAFAPTPRRGGAAPGWIDTVEALLREGDGAPPRLGQIAETVGRHPSHVAREYRRRKGETLGQRARRLQTARAAAAVAGSERPLAQIAQECGFTDQSHMGRAFRALLGTSPGAHRRRVREG